MSMVVQASATLQSDNSEIDMGGTVFLLAKLVIMSNHPVCPNI